MKIKELGVTVTGKTPSTKEQENFDGDYMFITPEDVHKGFFITHTDRTLSRKGLESIINNTIDGVSVLVNCIGDIGDVALVNGKCATNQQINAITRFHKNINPVFVYYYLKQYKRIFDTIAGNTVLKMLPKSTFDEVEVNVPSKDVQDQIANLLSTFDMKIANNNAICSNLECMAKLLYDYWFVQFDFPDENGKPYKTSGGKMVWNDELKREIPAGWGVGDVVNNPLTIIVPNGVKNFTNKRYLPTKNIVGESITEGQEISYANRTSRANMEPTQYSVWFAKMKNSVKHISIPENGQWFLEKYILSTGFVGLQCDSVSFGFIHCVVNSEYFERRKDALAHGATQESVNMDDLKNIKFAIPELRVLELFSHQVNPILEKKFDCFFENQQLISLRDFLLPLLMNGQVKIGKESA